MLENSNSDVPLKEQLGTLAHPKNLLKTIASQLPFASAGVEMLNQLEGQRAEKRISALEETDTQVLSKLQKFESSVSQPPAEELDWARAASLFSLRNMEFAVLYTPFKETGREYILPVGNGCNVGDDYVLTCSEVLELVQDVARHKGGRAVLLLGMVWYDFVPEQVDKATGLVLCRITGRNDEQWKTVYETFAKEGFAKWVHSPLKAPPQWSVKPYTGQEVGFILPTESQDNFTRADFTPTEFGTSVISHFKMPKSFGLKVFVTGVFPAGITRLGSAAFTRDCTLVGIISGVEKYKHDVGVRAVVKTLLGFPRFTHPKLKAEAEGKNTPAT